MWEIVSSCEPVSFEGHLMAMCIYMPEFIMEAINVIGIQLDC